MRPVGYGAMLGEGLVAVIALSVVMIMTREQVQGLTPGTIYGNGLGEFMTLIIGKDNLPFAITFGALAFNTFVFDTLDTATRLGRYIIQEVFQWKSRLGGWAATAVTCGIPAGLLANTGEGMWLKFWILFGASNQLLAALTLLSITVWLYRARKRIAFTLIPMVFVLSVTFYSLVLLAIGNWRASTGFDIALLNSVSSVLLMVLALYVAFAALVKLRSERLTLPKRIPIRNPGIPY